MHALRLAAALFAALALAPGLLARPLADAAAPTALVAEVRPEPPLAPQNARAAAAPAPKTHTYTRRARAHP